MFLHCDFDVKGRRHRLNDARVGRVATVLAGDVTLHARFGGDVHSSQLLAQGHDGGEVDDGILLLEDGRQLVLGVRRVDADDFGAGWEGRFGARSREDCDVEGRVRGDGFEDLGAYVSASLVRSGQLIVWR